MNSLTIDPISASTSVSASTTPLPAVGFDIITPLLNLFSTNEAVAGFLSFAGVLAFLGVIWSIFAVLSYIVAIIMLGLYVYASTRKSIYADLHSENLRTAERLYAEHFHGAPRNSRLNDVFLHAESENPNDWKLAIIEADIILDDTLKQRGYAGNSLGERLKSISPQQLSTVQDAWEAHKVRNRIAHEGSDFILTRRLVDETIAQYQRVFTEFGVS